MEMKISIPEGVNAKLEGNLLAVSGPKGETSREFRHPKMKLSVSGKEMVIKTDTDERRVVAIVYTWQSHLKNMITGVTKGWKATMKAVYSHFPVKIAVEGDRVVIQNFLGERKSRIAKIHGKAKVDIKKDDITVTGVDKEDVGQTCGNIEVAVRISGRDRRVFQDGIFISGKPQPEEEEA